MNTTWRKELIPDVLNLLLGAGLFVSPWVFGLFQRDYGKLECLDQRPSNRRAGDRRADNVR